ncbi:inward rectifier K channel (IRK-C) family protein [Thraustotheca clavata]|uniref:Inward rectifier K channel (IRK-C) family protein n=1 Tax=Thraustotheca clavata TaxID=74557 RepID=A0A1W0A2N1_9STRA|nr:inward rectifier K channel (IRK-C) family protein [Thraustotheca clavata]
MSEVRQPLLPVLSTKPKQRTRFLDRGGKHTIPVSEYGLIGRMSFGIYNIQRVGGAWRKIYWDDMFHTVINTRTSRLVTAVFVVYALVIFFFAIAYQTISEKDPECHVGIKSLTEAYIFSVETIMTIGYGAPSDDIFYGGCSSMAFLLTMESFSGIFLDSILIGMFFVRFSRADTRAYSIVFSKDAVIRKIRGHYYFMFQVCERRKHQLVEAHVRCYGIRNEVSADGDEGLFFQTHHMRLQQPDDDIGAYLLMALPQIVIHRIDAWSPLFPRECLPPDYYASTCPAFPDPMQRAIDHDNGNRDYDPDAVVPTGPTEEQIRRHIEKSELEVLVILEGEDSTTSNTMQARYSYTLHDIAWNCTFEKCVYRNPTDGIVVDFDKFHLVKPEK